ncbi:hypothetical protein [Sphingomonas pseudosanguinis]|uniref:Uncharacterized protein n=1 Tax=Sphingomonas pseudosanguinis TaxID=413712 RepID=A0A7W6F4Z4_9SPHN|nr:hypothetical protein [Sphingomonas pseudosanguinis]MBB3880995.1 hypothetical protein [Sphingomonas pseudosanguinis]MBN3535421.1 hypothetical protein [Sphingomonas pseudosanguinis]
MNPLSHAVPRAVRIGALSLLISVLAAPACAQVTTMASPRPADAAPGAPGLGYADLADLVLSAPVIADVTIRSTTAIKGAEAAGVAPGHQRLYVEADVGTLLRGSGGLPARVGYLFDAATDARGRVPKLRKMRVLIYARRVPNAPDQLQLVAPDAQLPWTPDTDQRSRTIARDALSPEAPPVITGVGNAFYVPGTLPGEGETQIFLTTAKNRPVSLSVLRRPGEERRWAVALSEIVDEAAAPPARDTLLWYRLACALPESLPDHSTASLSPEDAQAAREDYRYVVQKLGPCSRTRQVPTASS